MKGKINWADVERSAYHVSEPSLFFRWWIVVAVLAPVILGLLAYFLA